VTTIPIVPAASTARRGALARLGDAMRRHRRAIAAIQWIVVGFYAFLVAVPAFLPLPPTGASIVSNLTLFAQFAFWGIWWPFVIASTMLVGRAWCGIFCPEGTITEFASRHGLGKPIPRWMRWGGWPFVAFGMTTVYGQLVSVYEYPKAVLLILGGSTLGAAAVGFVYGRGKRVWCRYLCPVNGVFELLAKVAPVHFRADEAAWKAHRGRAPSIDCAPLVDLRHLQSASKCHSCGRCSGHRGAIALAARSPDREILALAPGSVDTGIALLLIFGVLGMAVGAFQWTVSPWFVAMKQALAEWLVDHDAMALLGDRAPWWLLTHYPEANDVFTWLDGLCILAYIGAVALAIGGATLASLAGASRLAGANRFDWKTLAMGLVPIGGVGLFLGLSMLTLAQLRGEHLAIPGIGAVRAALLAVGIGASAWLGGRMVLATDTSLARRSLALGLYAIPLALSGLAWYLVFWGW
jgi:polyferredoxin